MDIEQKPKRPKGFQKGKSGNPEGGRRHDPLKREIRKLTYEDLINLFIFALYATPDECEDVINDRFSGNLPKALMRCMQVSIETGDLRYVFMIIERIFGKVPDAVTKDQLALLERVKKIQSMDRTEMITNATKALEHMKSQFVDKRQAKA